MTDPDMTPSPSQLATWRDRAIVAAHAASPPLVKRFYEMGLTVDWKTDGTPVTVADREAELTIREALQADPRETFDMLGEEQGLRGQGTPLRWLIDPIDGTRSFINHIPLFGTLIALEDTTTQHALVGVIHLPVLGLTYAAARGLGSTCNGMPVRVSSESQLDQVILATGDLVQFSNANMLNTYQQLTTCCPYLRGYADCFGHSLVVTGAVAAMLDPALNPWDVRATQVLIEEAGGLVRIRPSAVPHKVDALFGNPALVTHLATQLPFT